MGSTQATEFIGDIISVKTVISLLKSILITKEAICNITDEGLMFTAEHPSGVRTVAYIKKRMFSRFEKQDLIFDPFAIQTHVLIESLGILGPAVTAAADTCRLVYNSTDGYLEIILKDEEVDMTTTCQVTTFGVDEISPVFNSVTEPKKTCQIIMKSQALLNVLCQVHDSCDYVTFTFSPEDESFILSGRDNKDAWRVTFASKSKSFVTFRCTEEVEFSYSYHCIAACIIALRQSSELSLEMTEGGALIMLIKVENKHHKGYIELVALSSYTNSE
ncbi:Rad1/Rec1/Rad17 [Spinellus fusiger]|nr:Rad1/Rec1/Rad17 [Spinellus fusiger]